VGELPTLGYFTGDVGSVNARHEVRLHRDSGAQLGAVCTDEATTMKAGVGQVVLLCGEAGIGKSRLTAAVLERLANEAHARLRNFCSP
jgi:predicted ATP-dependent serine protease